MSKILKEVLFSNKTYVKNFDHKRNLQAPPIKKFAILTWSARDLFFINLYEVTSDAGINTKSCSIFLM